ncbi:acyl carrier protein [Burkholderia sp. Ac-20392]|uniref:acyl carrier protein n=1 Tax=Burkholderia sp. Ac-20392 TaxID=2703905 RepID=UPI00197E0C1C|nr:acyl carrier protein [Burkholderia sp. Ac-20392]MBN3799996.1 acyl carrier protein [Burkholderia sp. Ac-20392]
MKEDIKNIVAQILYLSGPEQVTDTASLFRELNMSSIDYVDLCYELKDKVDNRISLENLWPFNRMLLDPQCHTGTEWTDAGWQQVCDVMSWNGHEKCSLQDLYEHFSVNYIEHRIAQFN